MSISLDIKKWCAIIKLEGYTTKSSSQALVEKFHGIVDSFKDAGIDLDVFLFLEDEKNESSESEGNSPFVEKPRPRKPDRLEDS